MILAVIHLKLIDWLVIGSYFLLLLIIGLLTRVVSALFAIEMLVTTVWVKLALGAGWNASDLDRMLLVAGVLMILAGPGAAAVDNLVFKHDNKRSIL